MDLDTKITILKFELERALRTAFCLPSDKPRGFGSGWPEHLREFSDLIGVETIERTPRTMATPDDIKHFDLFMPLILKVDPDHRKMTVARLITNKMANPYGRQRSRYSRARIGRRFGVSADAVLHRTHKAVKSVVKHLNRHHLDRMDQTLVDYQRYLVEKARAA